MINDIEDFFNRWGTYKKLKKDIEIVKFFLDQPEEEVRQKTIIDFFKNKMAPITIRKHLYGLVQKGILEESSLFPGTYTFYLRNYRKMGVDMDWLVRKIIGDDLYEIATSIWKEKHSSDEPGLFLYCK